MAIVVPIISTWDGTGVKKSIAEIKTAEGAWSKTSAIGSSMQSMGRSMTVGLTLPLALMGKAAVDVAREFDVSMRTIQVNAGATAEQMKQVEEAALKMGQDTIYSANQAADSFLELSKAGLPLEDILGKAGLKSGALYSAMNLAATEGMDLAFAAKIMAQAMNAYGIEAKDSSRITDILAAAAVASTSTVTDLASGLKYVSANAAALNQPIDETVTALALLNNVGLNATTAGTSLNQMLTGLISPTEGAAKTMKDLGINVFDAQGELLPMVDVIRELEEATKGMSSPERAALMRDLFNVRGARAANALLKQGVEGWKEMATATNEEGKAAELAEARMKGMNGALEQLRGSMETAALVLGRALEPVIIEVAGWLKQLADWFSGLSPKTQEWIVKIGLLVAVIGPLLIFFGMMITAIGAIGAVMTGVGATIAGVIAFIVGIGVAIWLFVDNAKKAFQSLKGGWAKVSQFLKDDWNRTKETAVRVWNSVKEFFRNLDIGKFLREDWERTKIAAAEAWRTIKTKVREAWSDIKDSVRTKSNEVVEWMRGFPDRISRAIGNLSRTLYWKGRELISGFFDGIKSIAGGIGSFIRGLIPGVGSFNYIPSIPVGAYSTMNYNGKTVRPELRSIGHIGSATVIIQESVDARTTAARVKRAIEGYDGSQGRTRGAPLRRTW